jgi:hypothetical protein
MIKTKKDFITALSKLKPEDEEDLKFCQQQIGTLVNAARVSEDSIKVLTNVINLLTILKERHVSYVIMWLKQGYMED